MDLYDGLSLLFEQEAGGLVRFVATISVERGLDRLAELHVPDAGLLWAPAHFRRGLAVEGTFGSLLLRRNGPRPLRSQRVITVEGPDDRWQLWAEPHGIRLVASDGRVLWRRERRSEQLSTVQRPEDLCVVGLAAFGRMSAALATVPPLTRY